MKNPCWGFTLIEVSIVIAIIATIVGGMLIGKSILTNSRLQRVITDANSYTTAAVNFKQTYQALPGDFNNAQAIWGIDSNCTTTSGNLTGLGVGGGTSGTCNGDGNGQITNVNSPESDLFWQHLFLAGMFSAPTRDCDASSVSSSPACSGLLTFYDSVIGFNVPAGSIRGSGFSVIWAGVTNPGDANYFQTSTDSTTTITSSYGNVLMFGASNVYSSGLGAVDYYVTRDPILPADQAAQIDAKMDDGLPASGTVRAYIPSSTITPNCTVASNSATKITLAATSTYNVSGGTSPVCSLIFVMGF